MVSVASVVNGFPLALGGIASPSRGVRFPLLLRLPGIGGRSRGAGEDIVYVGWPPRDR